LPGEGIALVVLGGVKSVDVRRDLKFDRTNLTVDALHPSEVMKKLMICSENFPLSVRNEVLSLTGGLQNIMQFGGSVLSVEGSVTGSASLDYAGRSGRAKLDVVVVRRRRVTVSFRYIRYPGPDGRMGGTGRNPAEAEQLMAVMNRFFMPSANVELVLRSARAETLQRPLGPSVTTEAFKAHVVPLRDHDADITVFFVGRWKGRDDPLGTAFLELGSVVLDDAPAQYIAPESGWPEHQFTDEQIYWKKERSTGTERDLHIVLAHELAHMLGAGHNYGDDNLMSMNRQDLKLTKNIVLAIGGK
jgi:hypothetical protein